MSPAPNEEAKLTARQLRLNLFNALESAIENDWEDVRNRANTVLTLAEHLRKIEESYQR